MPLVSSLVNTLIPSLVGLEQLGLPNTRVSDSISISISAIAGDNYITAAEYTAVTISGTTRGIADAETLTLAATDGTNNWAGTATVSGNAWTADTAIDMTGWPTGAITVSVELDSDPTINRSRSAVLDAIYGDDFVMVVRTTGATETVTIPCQNQGVFNAVIDWGDGEATSAITAYNDVGLMHEYAIAGDYIVRISGVFNNLYFNNTGDKLKVIKVLQLGDVGWANLYKAFYGCSNMAYFQAAPCDTSLVTNMFSMMYGWTNITITPKLYGLNTSSVTNMYGMMFNWKSITSAPDLSGFDTSNVTSLYGLLYGWLSVIIGDIGVKNFDLSSATNLVNFASTSTFSTAAYDEILIAWNNQAPPSGLSVSFGYSRYTAGGAAEAARTNLISTYEWTIVDGGLYFPYIVRDEGDSMGNSLGIRIAALTSPSPHYNTSVAGSTMDEVLTRVQDPANSAYLPYITVLFDGSQNGITTVSAYCDLIADVITELNHTKFVIVPPINPYGETYAASEQEAIYIEMLSRWPDNVYHWNNALTNVDNSIDITMFNDAPTDPLHLSYTGNQLLATGVLYFIQGKGW